VVVSNVPSGWSTRTGRPSGSYEVTSDGTPVLAGSYADPAANVGWYARATSPLWSNTWCPVTRYPPVSAVWRSCSTFPDPSAYRCTSTVAPSRVCRVFVVTRLGTFAKSYSYTSVGWVGGSPCHTLATSLPLRAFVAGRPEGS
jgi:hypothetical protein